MDGFWSQVDLVLNPAFIMYVLCFPFPSFGFLLSARMVPVSVPAARHNHLPLFSSLSTLFQLFIFYYFSFLHCTLDNTI